MKSNTQLINQVSPTAFNYWVRVIVTAGENSFVINQAITTGNFTDSFTLASGSITDQGCKTLKGTFTQDASGAIMVTWTAPSAGIYEIALKLDATSVKNNAAPTPTTVHYNFSTAGVDGSTSELDLVKK